MGASMNGKHIYLQPLGGIAGDMFVGAMMDAFPQWRDQVLADVSAVVPNEVGVARLTPVVKNGIAALHFSLDEASVADSGTPSCLVAEAGEAVAAEETGRADRTYRRVHGRTSAFAVAGRHHPDNRTPVSDYAGIRKVIGNAKLSGSTASHALAILEIIARAESLIHGVPLEKVHFHELAAWDSLMDVVAAGSVISALGAATWSIDALPLGSGQVRTQHGPLPVPAPATMKILDAYPWRSDNVAGERVTPTGAAIVRYLVPPEQLSRKPQGILLAGGYGAGTKNFPELANVLRVMAFDEATTAPVEKDSVAVLEFDIDDMSGEEIGIAAERLRHAEGILDVLLVPAQGKKGRPVTVFRLLVAPLFREQCSARVFTETSTIGLRWCLMDRLVLPRQVHRCDTGRRVKSSLRPDGSATTKIESDELESLAGLNARRRAKSRSEGCS